MAYIDQNTYRLLDSITQHDCGRCVKHAESISDKDYKNKF